MMTINELKDKYEKAHEAYLQYKDINGTNNVEAQFLPVLFMYKKQVFGDKDVIVIPDSFLNYLGVDFVASDGTTYDLKVCQYCKGTEVLIDAYSKPNNHRSIEDKINDYFIFVNADNIIITPRKEIEKIIPPVEKCFYMKRDVYKTKLKAIVDTKSIRKLIIAR
jgi:hypothetical protein